MKEDSTFKKIGLFVLQAIMFLAVAFVVCCVAIALSRRGGGDSSDQEINAPDW